MEINYPNQCIVCKSKNKLRCTGCNMVSYCGRDHQLQHWMTHKNFCLSLTKMLKEKNLTHIYENLKRSTWFMERDRIINEVRKKLQRPLNSEELFLLKSPRICFVCYEAKQELLKNCPNCPTTTFCSRHKNSFIHQRNCSIMQNRFDLITRKMNFDSETLENLIKIIGTCTNILQDQRPPRTMRDFFDEYQRSTKITISEIQKIFLSETFSISLTIYSIFQMLQDDSPTDLVLHLNINGSSGIFIGNFWEAFLHLLTDVKILKIVYIDSKVDDNYNISLCSDCVAKKKKLTIDSSSLKYETYMRGKTYKKPNLIAYFNISNPMLENSDNSYINTINKLNEINCPMLLTFLTESEMQLMKKNLIRSSINYSIIYSGYNDFASLMFHHEQYDGSLNRSSQFIIVFKDERSNFPESSLKEYWSRQCFYPTICHICRKVDPQVPCSRCGMIFYCGNKHRDRDWMHHRDVCEATCSLMNEMKEENHIFHKAKLQQGDFWLSMRIDALKEVQIRTGRILEESERQMFFFPRNCSICRQDEPQFLMICKCGTILCRLHRKDPKHQKLCEELSIAFQLATLKQKPSLKSILSTSLDSSHELPSSMQNFIKDFCKPSAESSNQNANSKDLITSDFLTSSLTLNYAIQKFTKLSKNSLIVIHIIGANRADLLARSSWKLLLYRLKNLKTLKVIFIGREIPEWSETTVDTTDFSQIAIKYLKVESHPISYDKYQSSKQFIKPDVIFGCNLNIHDSNIDMSEYYWKETILAMEKVRVPIILTAESEERALKEHKKISCAFNVSSFQTKNPFASLSPERDFETDGIMYCNSFIIIYNEPYRSYNLPKSLSVKELDRRLQQNQLKSRVTNIDTISGAIAASKENSDEELKSVRRKSEIHNKSSEIANKETSQMMSVSCENLTNSRMNNSETSFLIKHNSFLKSENVILRQQLDLAMAEIARLEDKIIEYQKSANDENLV
ncbi:uncharacterized protein LOC122508664 [Leptopilina heterotoma]|uniref:uncharacterized protein LOC122508664 n=1 Tax=Leptopilina heterotoma TaxID=63436 RepID=UPI001CA7E394|nr:uncharacterized protein LOC122508664 [Leptopilina heterotoma]XP_043478077.1 uncharacterized protein LOC122508664 [Leptopilina heterotoma]